MKSKMTLTMALTIMALLGGIINAPPAFSICNTESVGWPYLQGFDYVKLLDLTHTTPKYTFARIVCQYLPRPANLVTALPEIKTSFPGAVICSGKGDVIELPGVGVFDVIIAAGEGGKGWWWGGPTGQIHCGDPVPTSPETTTTSTTTSHTTTAPHTTATPVRQAAHSTPTGSAVPRPVSDDVDVSSDTATDDDSDADGFYNTGGAGLK